MALKEAKPHSLSSHGGEEPCCDCLIRSMKRKRFTRLVSQEDSIELDQRSPSPPRSVSEFDEVTTEMKPIPLVNPLSCPNTAKVHVAALRLEAELQPLRSILARLMGHQTHNRKGIFNVPVDAEALGLQDYHRLVTKPMDLGTVKRRLHSLEYESKDQAVSDIRLTFINAMRFNPINHPIHQAAKELLVYFEQAFRNTEGFNDDSTVMVPVGIQHSHTNAQIANSTCAEAPTQIGASSESNNSQSMSLMSRDYIGFSEPLPGGDIMIFEPLEIPKKTSKLPPFQPHSCSTCLGRTCAICHQGCLLHEPALMVCQGVHCAGSRLRKGTMYYVSVDGNRHYCERCYSNLTPVLPGAGENDPCRYKQDLLKRMNNEEIPEQWISCSRCKEGVHSICAMHDVNLQGNESYVCIDCQMKSNCSTRAVVTDPLEVSHKRGYTFISGLNLPVSMESLNLDQNPTLKAASLPECAISSFIQAKVEKCMRVVPNAEKTVTVRVISDSDKNFGVPEVIRRHFRMATESNEIVPPPSEVNYRQKAIALFQNFDGLDVCIFCMYVQEYEGNDKYDPDGWNGKVVSNHKRRVYIAYIDSVEHFRPRECRTEVYHEILVSYLATARARGYERAHIWACPPSRGNSFVFWNHPSSQRTPNQERLLNWYHGALSKAVDCGVVTDVTSLYSEFESYLAALDSSEHDGKRCRMICPPLLDGDFWIEEAVRTHDAHLHRNRKVRAPTDVCVWNVTPLLSNELDPCPALQIATLIKDRLMTHPASVPFRRPVNAAALKLNNYHEIVKKPMDLGTIYAQCVIGEYHILGQVVNDLELMVSNAKRFNPVGHFVHTKADEVLTLFHQELSSLIKIWDASTGAQENSKSWDVYSGMSMSLDERMEVISPCPKPISVFIEDDRSLDGSRSCNSTSVQSLPCSPCKDSAHELKITVPPAKKLSQAGRGRGRGKSRRGSVTPKVQQVPKKLDLLTGGPAAVMQNMVGQDFWLLDKRNPAPPIPPSSNGIKRRLVSSSCSASIDSSPDEPATKRRRQSWLGEEISETVRRMRTSFFSCSLRPKTNLSGSEGLKLQNFERYVSDFDRNQTLHLDMSSPICDARHALLEFSQYQCLEFDTLRRAKYSTAMLLHHLMNQDAVGIFPFCTTCDSAIEGVRWHKVRKPVEKRRVSKYFNIKQVASEPAFKQEELCGNCHAKHTKKDEFIPIPVSLKRPSESLVASDETLQPRFD